LTEPGFRRLWIAAIVVVVFIIVAGSLSPYSLLPGEIGSDKIGHYFAYLTLGILASGIVPPQRLWWAMLRCFLLGFGVEVAQAFLTDHRLSEWGDVLANGAGVLTAWLIASNGRAGWGLRAATRFIRSG
jgi:VanZ family protein